jgi:hypothetical protein
MALLALAAAACIGLVLACARRGADDDGTDFAIPPGQEELLADMLGRGVQLPGECTWTGGSVDADVVRSSYQCAGGPLRFELRRAADAPADAPRVGRFGVVAIEGSAPPDFMAALLARIGAREREVGWKSTVRGPSWPIPPGWMLLIVTVVLLVMIGSVETRGVAPLGAVRTAGMVGVMVVAWYAVGPQDEPIVLFGVLWVAAFSWLTVAGFFGYGDARRTDAVALAPFAVALAVRELFTLHSVQALELEFLMPDLWDRHSVLYPLLQRFFTPLVRDTQRFTMHMNGVLGALAVLPLYLFVRQRTGSRAASVFSAALFAVHPVISRFAPSDGSYSLMLATWFGGLALLTARRPDGRALLGGATLLAIAATSRVEGVTVLVASLLLVDVCALVAAARRHPVAATASVLVMAVLGAVHAAALLPFYLNAPPPGPPLLAPTDRIWATAVWPANYNDPLFMELVKLGVLVGLLPGKRLGLLAYLAMLVVLAPCAESEYSVIAFHRLIPACAMQTIGAGMGLYGVVAWMPAGTVWRWLKALPVIVALYLFVAHADELRTRYAFDEEYDLVRSHLVSEGVAMRECSLLTFTGLLQMDAGLHNFEQVAPGMRIVDCVRADCVGEVATNRCVYYVRSSTCYFYDWDTAEAGSALGEVSAPCAALERAVDLEAVDVRQVELVRTYPTLKDHYPPTASIALFRARPKRSP